MFRRVLVGNRGEVAARVLRTLRRMDIYAVAVASEEDKDLSYLTLADEVVSIGPPRAYLSADVLIEAALATRCSALHPGWGFLSENATFARRCEAARIQFIGPSSATMRAMADKAVARGTMAALGLHPIPGSEGILRTVAEAQDVAKTMGYPVLLKAVAGGGGRGMRRVFGPDQMAGAFSEASAEASSAFGSADLYMERLIENGRHIEFQVLGDGQQCVVLGARECSVQRRHQKLIEESPAPELSADQLQAVSARISEAVSALSYRGAGTVEMLQDPEGRLWFMEMNTRLQVEHTVTEMVTGIDLVEWQLRVAANQGLEGLGEIASAGHAIECRINAEDVLRGFQPCPGTVTRLVIPSIEGLRVDTHLSQGDRISPHYDSMFAKLIARGADRRQALTRMLAALKGLEIDGVPTTRRLHIEVLQHPEFVSGQYHTAFLEQNLESILAGMEGS